MKLRPAEDSQLPWEVTTGSASGLYEAAVLAQPVIPGGSRVIVASGSIENCEFIAALANATLESKVETKET